MSIKFYLFSRYSVSVSNQTQGKMAADPFQELTCPICKEVFIETMALGCGHKFCLFCIGKCHGSSPDGQLYCPCCRKKVTCYHPDVIVDNLIVTLFNNLSKEQQKARENLIKERKKEYGSYFCCCEK